MMTITMTMVPPFIIMFSIVLDNTAIPSTLQSQLMLETDCSYSRLAFAWYD